MVDKLCGFPDGNIKKVLGKVGNPYSLFNELIGAEAYGLGSRTAFRNDNRSNGL